MSSNLQSKQCKVLVVDPSGPVRQMMADIVRTVLGFEKVEGKSSLQDALQHLETDTAGWIIAPLMADQPANALHLLKICTETPELKDVRVSLFLDDEERYVLTPAFELGLFSAHQKPFTKDTLSEELKTLWATFEASGFSEPQTAANYLRNHLKGAKNYAAMSALEKSLLDLYPGNPEILLRLAEPQFNLGQKDLARKTLMQVRLLDPKLGEKAAEMAKAWFPETGGLDAAAPDSAGGGGVNVVGGTNAIVIDSDGASARGVEELLKGLGVPNVMIFPDGEKAWEHVSKAPEPDLIITEWRVPKLSGPLLIQRIRHHGYLNVPIVVLSSLLKPDDMPFVKELGVANIIQKPLNKDLFVPALLHTLQQERSPTELQALERKIRNALKANKKDQAEPLKAQYLADPTVSVGRKRLMEAEFAFAAGQYAQARDAAVDALKHAGDGIFVLNLLGKALMRLSDFDHALKCFSKAQQLSPHNLERLCLIAETQTELGDQAAAGDTMADAKSLDAGAKQVAEGETRVAITAGDTAAAKKLMGGIESIDSILGYMNNKAVALARCDKPVEAIELYKKTIESIPEDHQDSRAIVSYNMALAQIREGEIDAAIAALNKVCEVKTSRVYKKAGSLKERLKKAVAENVEFKLKSSGDGAAPGGQAAGESTQGSEENQKVIAALSAQRGDLCCFLVFNNPDQPDARVTSLLAKAPRFQAREAIARAEALPAAEKVAKSA